MNTTPMHPVLSGTATFGILTDENPRFPVRADKPLAQKLERLGRLIGLKYERVSGVYGGAPENSFIVYDVDPMVLSLWGTLYGQESIILSQNGQNRLLFTNGPQQGQQYTGTGATVFQDPPADYFSTVKTDGGDVHFSLNLNFEVLQRAA